MKICPNCGKEFEPNDPQRIYCTEKCQRQYNWKAKAGRAKLSDNYVSITFQCSKCDKTVVTDTDRLDKRTRFCSSLCEKRYWRHPPHESEHCNSTFRSIKEYASYEQRTNN